MSVVSYDSEDRRRDTLTRKDSLTTVYSSNSRLNLLQKRKKAIPNGSVTSVGTKMGDKFVTQRVLSAKTHKVKQLQNQLADAHYHLQELSNENKMLKAMQKKQEIALQRYESSNAELPQVLNSHSEEIRVQQTKFKQLKQQFREVQQKLKEKELQYQQLKDDHQHLLDLSRDRNLQEREKLQAQLTELSAKVQQQNATINQLQKRLSLEAKNFKHQLQNEINKHKDTRHDLELAVTNADKLSTIIEMKEKLLNTGSLRSTAKSPVKTHSGGATHRPTVKKFGQDRGDSRINDDGRHNYNENRHTYEGKYESVKPGMSMLERLEHSTRASDEETTVPEPKPRFTKNRVHISSSKPTANHTRKSSRESDDLEDLSVTVQNGMAELKMFDEAPYTREPPEETYKRMEQMKQDLLNKIKKGEDVPPRLTSAMRRRSTDDSIEESMHESDASERTRSRSRGQSAVSFYDDKINDSQSNSTTTVAIRGESERQLSGKRVEKYCDTIISGIEKSTKLIDRHIYEFQSSALTNNKLVEQLQVVDKINELVNVKNEFSENTLHELNNNFKMITEQVTENFAPTRRHAIGSKHSKSENPNLFGDSGLTNQDLLDDLLNRK